MITAAAIQANLKTKILGRTLSCTSETGSTHHDCREKAQQGGPEGLVVVTDHQTKGRGRQQSSWESPAGKDLLFSILLKPGVSTELVSRLTLVAAVAFQKVLQDTYQVDTTVKWPNDLLVDGKKIGGILSELTTNDDGMVDFVVVGLGLNVNSQISEYSSELQQTLTTLTTCTGKEVDRAQLLAELLNSLEAYYQKFIQGEWSSILSEYDQILVGEKGDYSDALSD
jgi:BirA family transcriptional regulator, biotin operon repressor / biotin---[acetyl-CoA-carboxylase] ligase